MGRPGEVQLQFQHCLKAGVSEPSRDSKSRANTNGGNSQPCVCSQGHTPSRPLSAQGSRATPRSPQERKLPGRRAAPSHLPAGCPGSCPGGRSGPSAGTLSSPAGATLGVTGGNWFLSLPKKKQLGKPKSSLPSRETRQAQDTAVSGGSWSF